jgi:hypothetical protein
MSAIMTMTLEESMLRFGEAFKRGSEGLEDAAKVYVRALDAYPCCSETFRERFIGLVPVGLWHNLEAVGRRWLHVQLLIGVLDRQKTALVKRLPLDIQDSVFKSKRFPLLLPDGGTVSIRVQDTTPDQLRQLIGDVGMRSLEEQRTYMENKHVQAMALPDGERLPYYIRGSRILFRRGTILTKREVKRVITIMKRGGKSEEAD